MLMDQGAPHPASVSAGQLTYKVSTCLTKCPICSSRHLSPPPQGRARRSPPCLLMGQRVRHPGGVPAPLQVQLSSANGAAPAPLPPGPAAKGGEGGEMSQQQWHGEREAPYSRGLSAGHERPWHTAGYPDRRSQRIALIERPTPPAPSVAPHGAPSLAPSWQRKPGTARC